MQMLYVARFNAANMPVVIPELAHQAVAVSGTCYLISCVHGVGLPDKGIVRCFFNLTKIRIIIVNIFYG